MVHHHNGTGIVDGSGYWLLNMSKMVQIQVTVLSTTYYSLYKRNTGGLSTLRALSFDHKTVQPYKKVVKNILSMRFIHVL